MLQSACGADRTGQPAPRRYPRLLHSEIEGVFLSPAAAGSCSRVRQSLGEDGTAGGRFLRQRLTAGSIRSVKSRSRMCAGRHAALLLLRPPPSAVKPVWQGASPWHPRADPLRRQGRCRRAAARGMAAAWPRRNRRPEGHKGGDRQAHVGCRVQRSSARHPARPPEPQRAERQRGNRLTRVTAPTPSSSGTICPVLFTLLTAPTSFQCSVSSQPVGGGGPVLEACGRMEARGAPKRPPHTQR